MKSNRTARKGALVLGLLLYGLCGMGQTTVNDFQMLNSVEASIKLIKKLRLNLTPELRIDEHFSVDNFQMECELVYKPWKFLAFGGSYRFVVNPRPSKTTEYLHRYAFQATVSTRVKRFEPAFRLKYTNYTQDEPGGHFLKYRASVDYDIRKCKLTPFLQVEAYHELTDNYLYKMRYGAGLQYSIFKNNTISLEYKFDYYLKEYLNNHILCIRYKIKL